MPELRPSGTSDSAPKPRPGKDPRLQSDTALIAAAQQDYEAGHLRERQNMLDAYEDLRFLAGEQWDQDSEQARKDQNRPMLTINRLPQFCRQVTGDIRQMRPAIKVVPVDDQGDADTAEKIAGLVRYIENRSVAKAAYFSGADSQVACGIGHWRVLTEYAGDSTFDQEIKVAPIEDGVGVVWDPDAVDQTRADARFCFVPVDMSRAAFEAKYDRSAPTGMPGDHLHDCFNDWYSEDYVRVAEYWFKVEITRTLLLNDEGKVVDLTEKSAEDLAQAEAVVAFAKSQGRPDVRIEKRPGTCVYRALITGDEVLEKPVKWPGRHIPIIRVPGGEIRIGRRVVRYGVVRFAKDPQRLYNYFNSAQAEVVALQPKSPFIGTTKNFQNNQEMWEQANDAALPYLEYEPDPLNSGAAPQRSQPPVSSQGIEQCLAHAAEDMKATIGIYDASLGQKSNETSGKAILARQREGDTGTYVFVENFGQAVAHTGAVIVDLIPHIYDTQRTIRILGEDGTLDKVTINRVSGKDPKGNDLFENDVTVGAYDVVMQLGPSFTTKREEAREALQAFIQGAPDLAPALVDVWASLQDLPNKDDLVARMEALLPDKVQAVMRKKRGEEPPPPDPILELKATIEKGELELTRREQDVRMIEANAKEAKAKAEAAKALQPEAAPAGTDPEADLLAAAVKQAEADLAARKIALQNGELDIAEVTQRTALIQAETALVAARTASVTAQAGELQAIASAAQPMPGGVAGAVQVGEDGAITGEPIPSSVDLTVEAMAPFVAAVPEMTAQAIAPTLEAVAQALTGVTQTLARLTEVQLAPVDIVRDPKTNLVIRGQKVLPAAPAP
jgi:hypothetical protein